MKINQENKMKIRILPIGGNYRRSVCVDSLYSNEDVTIQKVIQTNEWERTTN
jgi:hypothetical protein